MKTIFEIVNSNVKSSMTVQESGIIEKRIKELEELSNDFISKAYDVDQDKTIEFLKEARIGGYSIIGELWNGATRWTSNTVKIYLCFISNWPISIHKIADYLRRFA